MAKEITFIQKVGASRRITIPKPVAPYFVGKTVEVTIRQVDLNNKAKEREA